MVYILMLIIQSVWFSLPMYAANLIPVVIKRLPILNIPIDGGIRWRGKPIFGSHKTVRGFVFGIFGAIVVAYLQYTLFSLGGVWQMISLFDYSMFPLWFFGFCMGFGALVGDAVESFFKRRIGIDPGKSWLVFDQVDYVVGALLFTSILFIPSVLHIITILVLGIGGSFVSSYVGFHVGFKESRV
jgi:CDP-2,3-bis-(O-geranylgeranyl)-sn-glycerol synthase